MGCFPSNSVGLPAQTGNGIVTNDDNMSFDECSISCRGRAYFSIVYGRTCFCGDTIGTLPTSQPTQCTFPNSGAPDQAGGSADFQSLYRNDPGVLPVGFPGGSTAPEDGNGVSVGDYINCFPALTTDAFPSPLFKGLNKTDPALTQQKCASFCVDFKFYGLQNGNQCWCTNSYSFADGIVLRDYLCNVRAVGDRNQAAGAVDKITAFRNPKYQVRNNFLLCVQSCALQS